MRLPVLTLLPVFVIACDSPGGGGGGVPVDCTAFPNAPVCRGDATGDSVQPDVNPDTIEPDTTQPDTTSPDTTQPDTTQPDTTQPDTTQPDTTPPPECTGGATRCAGQEAQACSGGSWVTTAVCGNTTTCQNGACVPTATCTNGQRRCQGNNVEQCTNGQWTFAESCANGCSNNQCQAGTGLSCDDVFQCIIDAGCFANLPTPPTTACTNPCLNQGSATGRSEMNAMLSCYSGCSYDDACIINTCYQQRANCFFDTTGNLTCAQIDDCIGNCPSGGQCVLDCYGRGTNAAQGQYLRVTECLNGYCGEDTTCWGQVIAAGGPCETAYNTCFP